MFVVIADVTLKPDSIDDFKKWFAESNKIVSTFDGFISRRLLQSYDGKHRIIVEFDNKEALVQCIKAKSTPNYIVKP